MLAKQLKGNGKIIIILVLLLLLLFLLDYPTLFIFSPYGIPAWASFNFA
jgi:signal peptidase I